MDSTSIVPCNITKGRALPRTHESADQSALETGSLAALVLPPEQEVGGLNQFRCFQR